MILFAKHFLSTSSSCSQYSVDFLSTCPSFIQLSSELQVNINTDDLYFKFDKKNFKPVSFSKSFDDFAFKDKEVNIIIIFYSISYIAKFFVVKLTCF